MNRIGYFLLNSAVALYLFANGIMGFTKNSSCEFRTMVRAIGITGELGNILVIALSICGIAAGIFLLLELFKVDVPITGLILFIFIIVWIVFIIIKDIIHPLRFGIDPLNYMVQLATHLMVLGALVTSTKKFERR